MGERLKVVFMGNRQAGVLGLLTLLAKGHTVSAVVAYGPEVERVAGIFCVPCFMSIKAPEFIKASAAADLLVCVHGREIVGAEMLAAPARGAINVHPYLYKYKGANPIGRALEDNNYNASVGVHRMTEVLDTGELLAEEYLDVTGAADVEEVYSRLYPVYCEALAKALDKA